MFRLYIYQLIKKSYESGKYNNISKSNPNENKLVNNDLKNKDKDI